MRKFLIQNETGETIPLQGGSVFFSAPTGWGILNSISYMETGGYFIKTHQQQSQVAKTGTLVFFPQNAYGAYQSFADWVFAAKQLTLGYNPNGEWHYVDVDIQQMDKTELTVGGALEIPITFLPTTPIYKKNDMNLYFQRMETGNTKRYPYSYWYSYAVSSASGTISFSIPSQMACDYSISFLTPIESPIITVSDGNGAEFGKVDLSGVKTNTGETLVFSTIPLQSGAYIHSENGITDVTENLGIDSALPTFFKLPANQLIQLKIVSASVQDIKARLSIRQYYRTV